MKNPCSRGFVLVGFSATVLGLHLLQQSVAQPPVLSPERDATTPSADSTADFARKPAEVQRFSGDRECPLPGVAVSLAPHVTMKPTYRSLFSAGILLTAVAIGLDSAPGQAPAGIERGMEVETRGPIHEAFAQPIEGQPGPGPIVPKGPPEPIPEIPAEQKPVGDNVQWMGGYWAWDADRNNFLWVSGVYRNTPTGQRFVSGYWEQTGKGWRWVPGFWTPAHQQAIPYVPQPPPSLDIGPSLPPPGDDYFYVPGCWVYRDLHFVWRPGFWRQHHRGFVWMAPRYAWTPAGYVFCDGYWDYPLDGRGLLFAPVYFDRPLWHTAHWHYRPRFVVGIDAAFDSLFVRVGLGHYYFGNYYGDRYRDLGFRPWFDFGSQHYDPFYAHARWQNRLNPGWEPGLRRTHEDRLSGRAPLPPRTFQEQVTLAAQSSGKTVNKAAINRNPPPLVAPVTQTTNVKLVNATPTQVAAEQANAKQLRELSQERRRQEAVLAKGSADDRGVGKKPRTLSLPVSGAQPSNPAPKQVNNPPPPKNDPPPRPKDRDVNPPPAPKQVNNPPPPPKNDPPPRPKDRDVNPPPAPKQTNDPPPRPRDDPPPRAKDRDEPPKLSDPPPRRADPPPRAEPPPRRADPPPRASSPPPRSSPPARSGGSKGKGR